MARPRVTLAITMTWTLAVMLVLLTSTPAALATTEPDPATTGRITRLSRQGMADLPPPNCAWTPPINNPIVNDNYDGQAFTADSTHYALSGFVDQVFGPPFPSYSILFHNNTAKGPTDTTLAVGSVSDQKSWFAYFETTVPVKSVKPTMQRLYTDKLGDCLMMLWQDPNDLATLRVVNYALANPFAPCFLRNGSFSLYTATQPFSNYSITAVADTTIYIAFQFSDFTTLLISTLDMVNVTVEGVILDDDKLPLLSQGAISLFAAKSNSSRDVDVLWLHWIEARQEFWIGEPFVARIAPGPNGQPQAKRVQYGWAGEQFDNFIGVTTSVSADGKLVMLVLAANPVWFRPLDPATIFWTVFDPILYVQSDVTKLAITDDSTVQTRQMPTIIYDRNVGSIGQRYSHAVAWANADDNKLWVVVGNPFSTN